MAATVIGGIASDGNTSFVASDNAALSGPPHTVIVEIIGSHLFTLPNGNIQLTS